MIVTSLTTDIVRGALELEPTAHGVRIHRLPAWARAQNTDDYFASVEAQPSGVRIAFRSRATSIELDAYPTRISIAGAPPRPDGIFDLAIDGVLVAQASVVGGESSVIDPTTGAMTTTQGEVGTLRFEGLPDADKRVEIWLPHYESTALVELRTDAAVSPLEPGARRTWLHHGSSISQGSNAATPTGIWPVVAATGAQVELINLGYSGNAMLDPFTARTMRDTPADVISVKLGINLLNGDLMRLRAFGPAVHGFLDTIREGHPETPLLVVSPLYCPIHEETPGPGSFDPEAAARGEMKFISTGDPAEVAAGKLTLQVIRRELARIVGERAAADPNIHYLDGLELYGVADHDELPLPDRLHPDAAAHRRIGERFAGIAFGPGGVLAGS